MSPHLFGMHLEREGRGMKRTMTEVFDTDMSLWTKLAVSLGVLNTRLHTKMISNSGEHLRTSDLDIGVTSRRAEIGARIQVIAFLMVSAMKKIKNGDGVFHRRGHAHHVASQGSVTSLNDFKSIVFVPLICSHVKQKYSDTRGRMSSPPTSVHYEDYQRKASRQVGSFNYFNKETGLVSSGLLVPICLRCSIFRTLDE